MTTETKPVAAQTRGGLSALPIALAIGAFILSAWSVGAAPQPQTAGPSATVSPAQVMPGDAVRVSVTGLTGLPMTGTNLCIGFLGPGNNLELGLSPSFRSRLGTVAIGAAGTGEADVRVPVQAAAGIYRIRVGGCPPQPDLAPLAAIAEAQLTVTRGGASGLPATGGALSMLLPLGAAFTILAGAAARLTRRSASRT